MTRRSLHRAAAWLMTLLLALVALEPLRAHACPRHFGAAPASSAATDAHAGHGTHAPVLDAASQDGESHERHPCDCLGSCGLAPTIALPAADLVGPRGAERAIAAPPAATSPETVALAREHLLPFANGPPARG